MYLYAIRVPVEEDNNAVIYNAGYCMTVNYVHNLYCTVELLSMRKCFWIEGHLHKQKSFSSPKCPIYLVTSFSFSPRTVARVAEMRGESIESLGCGPSCRESLWDAQ